MNVPIFRINRNLRTESSPPLDANEETNVHRAASRHLSLVHSADTGPRVLRRREDWFSTIRSVVAQDHPMTEFTHVPVMVEEVLAWLEAVPSGLVVDATCGGAGHSQRILESRDDLRVIGLDRDPMAVDVARARLARFGDRARVVHCRFDELAHNIDEPIVGALFDLGVSSAQFDHGDRGFSYRYDAPLDMRMDTTAGPSAAEIVNSVSVGELRHVLKTYGDERFADRIARAIVAARPVTSTAQLAQVVTDAIPAATRRTGGHPAKRTFQALRIEVNDELRVLGPALDQAIDALALGGRCIVLSYHSGEDRIVKDRFREAETGGCSCPSGLPCVCGALPRGRMVRRGVTRPTAAEQAANPRAASAVARVFEATTSGARTGVVSGFSGRPSVRPTGFQGLGDELDADFGDEAQMYRADTAQHRKEQR